MVDRGKVLKALECCRFLTANVCKECPYSNVYGSAECGQMAKDALELLKEQEKIIEQYHKADAFLEVHGWKWEGAVKWDAAD